MSVVLYVHQAKILYEQALEQAGKDGPDAVERFRTKFPDYKVYCDWLEYKVVEQAKEPS